MAGPADGTGAGSQDRGQLRASHTDREQVIEVLKAAFVQERLTRDEFELRIGQALTARTYAEQDAVIADLPAGLMRTGRPSEPVRARTPGGDEIRTGVRVTSAGTALAALLWVVAIVAGDNGAAYIAAFWATGLVIAAAALTGSAALGSWLDRRRGGKPPRPLAGGQASQLPGSAAPAGLPGSGPSAAVAARTSWRARLAAAMRAEGARASRPAAAVL